MHTQSEGGAERQTNCNQSQVNSDIDRMLDVDEAASWLGMNKRTLLKHCKGRRAMIPGFWLNERVVRFHMRTIICKLASERVHESIMNHLWKSFELFPAKLSSRGTVSDSEQRDDGSTSK